mmetsp:Transcript_133951/g.346940  ORF Transcript_133951/g.346940 Transcript_133951/m.346940 type:complete len:222 (-) Transcript_133951:2098-2763(-)
MPRLPHMFVEPREGCRSRHGRRGGAAHDASAATTPAAAAVAAAVRGGSRLLGRIGRSPGWRVGPLLRGRRAVGGPRRRVLATVAMGMRRRSPSCRWASAADCWWPSPVRGTTLPRARRRLPGRRCWGITRKFELCGLIASIQAALAVSPVLLYKLHEVCDRCVLTKDRLQEGGFLVHSQSVLDQLDKPSQVLGVVAFEAKSLLEIPVVIEAKVLLHEAWPI